MNGKPTFIFQNNLIRNDVARVLNNEDTVNSGFTIHLVGNATEVVNIGACAGWNDLEENALHIQKDALESSKSILAPLIAYDESNPIKGYVDSIWIDRLTDKNIIKLHGWAADTGKGAPVSRIKIGVDGKEYEFQVKPGKANNEPTDDAGVDAGFHIILPIPKEEIETITVKAGYTIQDCATLDGGLSRKRDL